MAEKFLIGVSPELQDVAQYRQISDIRANDLPRGSTLYFYPGNYGIVTANLDGVSMVGIGDRANVVFEKLNLDSGSANNIIIENITVKGNNSTAATNGSCIDILGTANPAVVTLRRCTLSNSDFAITHHGNSSSQLVSVEYCDASACDRGIRANSNTYVAYTLFNKVSTNAMFTPGGGAATKTFFIGAFTNLGTLGANTGNSARSNVAVI